MAEAGSKRAIIAAAAFRVGRRSIAVPGGLITLYKYHSQAEAELRAIGRLPI